MDVINMSDFFLTDKVRDFIYTVVGKRLTFSHYVTYKNMVHLSKLLSS